ncbi:hypothetical protein A2118_01905 [Candidatus Kaiserbacteria bacterium GWA2_50_9]|uniref:Uncharacterized protein n=1 Tax=Candidatus Kaiserbacteria bacterium GWA2_50_9 TaxID=1798474 RepID=A0A1F6BUM3_9BACT|nr:MAG: hypothetical protein A2118_01905 [Candidatus Kaiserbacteria bacterium GWA2_50_9]
MKNGLSLDTIRNVAAEPTRCPGYACPKPSDACDACLLSDVFIAKLIKLAGAAHVVGQSNQGRHDAQRELYMVAPMSRGSRALAEYRVFKRMGF